MQPGASLIQSAHISEMENGWPHTSLFIVPEARQSPWNWAKIEICAWNSQAQTSLYSDWGNNRKWCYFSGKIVLMMNLLQAGLKTENTAD